MNLLKKLGNAGPVRGAVGAVRAHQALAIGALLWGNFEVLQDNPHSLRPGQELRILPADGTYYEWQSGDGLNGVASFFGVAAQDIIDWPGNNLPQDLDPSSPGIAAGTGLVVPGGAREFASWRAPRITRANPAVASIAGPGACGQPVFQGNVIGGVGSTGNSTGSHLHFELESDSFGKVNPYNFTSP